MIQTPMDFGTIKKKLSLNIYKNVEEFLENMALVFSNCKLYNGTETPVGKIGVLVRSEYIRLLGQYNFVERFQNSQQVHPSELFIQNLQKILPPTQENKIKEEIKEEPLPEFKQAPDVETAPQQISATAGGLEKIDEVKSTIERKGSETIANKEKPDNAYLEMDPPFDPDNCPMPPDMAMFPMVRARKAALDEARKKEQEKAKAQEQPLVQEQPKSQPVIQEQPEPQPLVQEQIRPQLQPQPQPQALPQPQAIPQPQLQAQPLVQQQLHPQPQTFVQPQRQPLIEEQYQPIVEEQSQPIVEEQPQPQPQVQPQPLVLEQSQPQPQVQPQLQPQPQLQFQPQPQLQFQAQPQAQPLVTEQPLPQGLVQEQEQPQTPVFPQESWNIKEEKETIPVPKAMETQQQVPTALIEEEIKMARPTENESEDSLMGVGTEGDMVRPADGPC